MLTISSFFLFFFVSSLSMTSTRLGFTCNFFSLLSIHYSFSINFRIEKKERVNNFSIFLLGTRYRGYKKEKIYFLFIHQFFVPLVNWLLAQNPKMTIFFSDEMKFTECHSSIQHSAFAIFNYSFVKKFNHRHRMI